MEGRPSIFVRKASQPLLDRQSLASTHSVRNLNSIQASPSAQVFDATLNLNLLQAGHPKLKMKHGRESRRNV